MESLAQEPIAPVTEGVPQPTVEIRTSDVEAGEHPLLRAARIVEEAAGRVEASGQVPAQTVAGAIAQVRAALEASRQQAAAIGQQPAVAAGETMAGGRAAAPSAADQAFAAAQAALDRAAAIVAGAGAPRPSGELPPVDATDVANALQAAIGAARNYHATVNQPQQQEAPSAVQVTEDAPVLQTVREQPIEGAEAVSTATSPEGVLPGAGPPRLPGKPVPEQPKPAPLATPSAGFQDWRVQGNVIRHSRVGQRISPEEAEAIISRMPNYGLRGRYDASKGTVVVNSGILSDATRMWESEGSYAKQAGKRVAERQAIETERQDVESQREAKPQESDAAKWIDDVFGADAMNSFNKLELAKFLEGKTQKFGGASNAKWREGLSKLKATSVADIKAAYEQVSARAQLEAEEPGISTTEEPSKRIESYGERYVREQGLEGAKKRVEHLRRRIDEENAARNPDAALRLAQEVDNIQNAITKLEPVAIPPRNLPGAGINSKDVARQYGMPEDFYGTADESGGVSSKYRTKEYDDALAAEERVAGLQGINATTIRRQARQRTEAAFKAMVESARKTMAEPPKPAPTTGVGEWNGRPLSYWKSIAVPQKLGQGSFRTGLSRLLGTADTPAAVARGLQKKISELEANEIPRIQETVRPETTVPAATAGKPSVAPEATIESLKQQAATLDAEIQKSKPGTEAQRRRIQKWMKLTGDIAKLETGQTRSFFPRRSEAQGLGEQATLPTVEDVRRQRAMDRTGVPPPAPPESPPEAPAGAEKPFTVSAKNAATAQKRAELGLPAAREEAARKWGSVWEQVLEETSNNALAGKELVDSINANPRAVTSDKEIALLDHEMIRLEEQKNRVERLINDAAQAGNEISIPENRAKLDTILDQLTNTYDASKVVGREQARAFNIRKMMVDENYTIQKMLSSKRAMNDGLPLSKEQKAEVLDLHNKITEAETKYNDYVKEAEERIRKLELQHAADELKIAAAREAKADAASGTTRDLGAERDAIVAGLGERAGTPVGDLRNWIRKLALNFIRSGVEGRDAVVNAVHDVLKDIIPNIEIRDTADAISGYGDFRRLDPEAAKAKLRDYSGQLQNVSKLEDLLARRALKKTGPERKVASDEERRLIKLVNEYKKRYGVVVTDPATQLKSALSAVKTRLANQIKDLEFQIGTGKKIVKGATKVAYDAEATALQARRDALKAQFDEIFGKPELTDAQRVAMATKGLERSITELQRRISAGETRTGKPLGKTPVTPELTSLREQQSALRDQLQELRDADTLLREEREVSSLQSAIENIERSIAEGDLFAEQKAKAEATAITGPLREQKAALQRELAELRRISPEGVARAEAGRIAAIEKQIADLEGRITRGELDLAKKPARILSEAEKGRREVLSQTREILREAREGAGLFDAGRIANAEKALDKAIAETMRQINEGDIGPRDKPTRLTSPEIEAKRAELEDLRKIRQELRDAATPKKTREEIALNSLKTRLRNQSLDYNKRLARGDFNVPVRKPVTLDAEALRLQRIRDYNRSRFQESLAKDRFKKLSTPRRVWERTKSGLDLSRSLVTSLDLSALLRQGKFIVAGHPIRAAKAIPEMLVAGLSKDKAYTAQKQIEHRPNYARYKQSGLFIAEEGARITKMEEAYMMRQQDLLEKTLGKIPLVGKAAGFAVGGSQRAYNTFLNRLRADSFDAMSESLSRHRPMTETEAKVLSNFINNATGRGSLETPFGSLERAATELNRVFFSPRYVASRFQMILGPLSGFRFGKGATARTRSLIAQEYAKTLIGYAAFYILAKMALPDSEIEIDPRSSDAGKIKIRNTRLDPLAGLQQATVLLSRVTTGETTTLDGRVLPIRGEDIPYGGTTVPGAVGNFLRSKLAPVPGTALNIISGENIIGEPVTPLNVVTGLTVPLAWQDVLKVMEDQGIPRGTALQLLSIFGEGVQVYEER